ncbi:MAG: carbon-nitrogen hydrolase family protein [Bacilli bacterium]|jgi:hydrolase, carbon-nitrogen family|nr:carbon-nitrogen hydrolase family protein [Staphylococcus sp.]
MNEIKIALLQIMPGDSIDENIRIGIRACKKAKNEGADIVLFPEMWSNGYKIVNNIEELKKNAISLDSAYIKTFQTLAQELNLAIAITLLEKYEPLPRNTIILFDRFGKQILTYAKVHTCDFDLEKNLTPGDDFYVANLNTEKGSLKIGAMICYDREFPESARILMLKGAEIIIVPNACPMEINRLSQLRARAFENMVGIATCNYPKGYPDCNGHSSAFDGVAYLPFDDKSRDTCILEAGLEEGIYYATFSLDMMRDYRKNEVHGNAYRHPSKYHLIIDEQINEPFIRKDYRK